MRREASGRRPATSAVSPAFEAEREALYAALHTERSRSRPMVADHGRAQRSLGPETCFAKPTSSSVFE